MSSYPKPAIPADRRLAGTGASVHWLRELPDEWVYDDETFLCTQRVADRLAMYETSTPTGPSPGRIYARHYGYADPSAWSTAGVCGPDWHVEVYICVQDPEDEKAVYHYLHRLVIVR